MTVPDDSDRSIRTGSVAAVVERLRAKILDGTMAPGEPIRQEDMARRLGISRVPLREALRVLATQGLLNHRPNQGYSVAKLSEDETRQIYALLEFLETELMRTARWPSDAEIAELRALNAEIADAGRVGDHAAVNRLNRALHSKIFALSPHEVFMAEAERFWTLSDTYRLLHVASTDVRIAVNQHEELIDALAAQNRPLSLRLHIAHRRDAQDAVLAMIERIDPSDRTAI